jgi:hypothetical protein
METNAEPMSQLLINQIRPSEKKITMLLRELSDEGDSDDDTDPWAASFDPKKPWLKEYHLHLNVWDELARDQSIVQWWGVWVVAF